MFRLPGADRTPDKAAIEEERRRAKQNVWFTMKAFVAYVVVLRLGKVFTSRLLHRFESTTFSMCAYSREWAQMLVAVCEGRLYFVKILEII